LSQSHFAGSRRLSIDLDTTCLDRRRRVRSAQVTDESNNAIETLTVKR
jgi:hypothetical protein